MRKTRRYALSGQKNWQVEGYCRISGKKIVITVPASTAREAKTKAYSEVTYPRVL